MSCKIEIKDNVLKQDIEKYFSLLYHPKDIKNKNKFKLGKCIVGENVFAVFIYAKPRNNYFNAIFKSEEYFNDFVCDENPTIKKCTVFQKGTSCGGFRV